MNHLVDFDPKTNNGPDAIIKVNKYTKCRTCREVYFDGVPA